MTLEHIASVHERIQGSIYLYVLNIFCMNFVSRFCIKNLLYLVGLFIFLLED